jgi:ATP-binding cassette, subfamily B, bacterial
VSRLRRLGSTLALVFRVDRRRATFVLVCLVVNSIVGGVLSIALKWVVDAAVTRRFGLALAAAILIGISQGIYHAAWRVQRKYQELLTQEVSAVIDRDVLRMTAGVTGIEHFERPDYLDQLSLIVGRGGDIADATWAITNAVGVVLRLVVAVWLLVLVDARLAVLPIFALPSLWITTRGQRRLERVEESIAADQRLVQHMHTLFLEPGSAKEVRLFTADEELSRRADDLYRGAVWRRMKANLINSLWDMAGWAMFSLAFGGALAIVAYRALHGHGTPGEVVLVMQLATQVRFQIAGAADTLQNVVKAFLMMDRLSWLSGFVKAAELPPAAADVPDTLSNGIRIDDVWFRYPGTDRDVLRGISLDLPAGSTVALVGDNGAGKTTLVKLLARYYEQTAGTITVDGVPLNALDAAAWRKRLSGAFQDYAKIETLLKESVGVGDLPAVDDDEHVRAALTRGAATDLLEQWSHGLATRVGRSYYQGVEPSGGQWQKIAVARGMMRPPLVLILDEPTAALDVATEDELYRRYSQAAADGRARGAVTVLVSHRFATVRAADRIFVISDGVVAEEGTHDELMARRGRYAEMFEFQASAYHS